MTVCPFCQTSGVDFPLADENYQFEPAEGEPEENEPGEEPAERPLVLALICTVCDEPWVPGFLRRCEWCGHDFGEGIDNESLPLVRSLRDESPGWNARAVAAVIVMAALLGGLVLYLASLAPE